MVLGILALSTFIYGLVFAVLALVFGYRAKRLIAESGGYLLGAGHAKAGRIMGWIWVGLLPVGVVLAAVVFVLVTKLAGAGGVISDHTVTVPAGEAYGQTFQVYVDQGLVNYTVNSPSGTVRTGFYVATSATNPNPASLDGWAESSGKQTEGSATLARGTYTLLMACNSPMDCQVHYTIYEGETGAWRVAAGATSATTPCDLPFLPGLPGRQPGCQSTAGTSTTSAPSPGHSATPCVGPAIPDSHKVAVKLQSWEPSGPPKGNYVYLEGQSGDYVLGSHVYTYTESDSHVVVTSSGAYVHVSVAGEESWTMDFALPDACKTVGPGYFDDLQRYPFHNAVKGGLDLGGEGRGCNKLRGGFAIDQAMVDANGALQSIVLRFEQHCEGGSPYSLGKIVWSTGAPPLDPGPTPVPEPAVLTCEPASAAPANDPLATWQPAHGLPPNSFVMEGNGGSNPALAEDYSFGADAQEQLHFSWNPNTPSGDLLRFQGTRTNTNWANIYGTFIPPYGCTQLKAGYYGGLSADTQAPDAAHPEGRFYFNVNNVICSATAAALSIDSVSDGSATIRFEATCAGETEPVFGKIDSKLQ